jgi:SAM-dependent methyltransferase
MDVKDIYDANYAPIYRQLYIEHPQWRPKHDYNVRTIRELLPDGGTWLDTCCGQGWQLSQFPDVERTGLDVSAAQLERAAQNNPGVELVEADIRTHEFEPGRQFDLVTNFWGSYSYLDDERAIRALVAKLIRWVAPGGALYIELITPQSLDAYNEIAFAMTSQSCTRARSDDFVRWAFDDPGGEHHLTSPPVSVFRELVEPAFVRVDSSDIITTMQQLIARGRR